MSEAVCNSKKDHDLYDFKRLPWFFGILNQSNNHENHGEKTRISILQTGSQVKRLYVDRDLFTE